VTSLVLYAINSNLNDTSRSTHVLVTYQYKLYLKEMHLRVQHLLHNMALLWEVLMEKCIHVWRCMLHVLQRWSLEEELQVVLNNVVILLQTRKFILISHLFGLLCFKDSQ
jgi:hypothetical protein